MVDQRGNLEATHHSHITVEHGKESDISPAVKLDVLARPTLLIKKADVLSEGKWQYHSRTVTHIKVTSRSCPAYPARFPAITHRCQQISELDDQRLPNTEPPDADTVRVYRSLIKHRGWQGPSRQL